MARESRSLLWLGLAASLLVAGSIAFIAHQDDGTRPVMFSGEPIDAGH